MNADALIAQMNQSGSLASLAEKLGAPSDMVARIAHAAASHAQADDADIEQLASRVAGSTGFDLAQIQGMLPMLLTGMRDHAGAIEGALGGVLGKGSSLAAMLSSLDADKDGSLVDDAMGLVGGLFGKK